MGSESNSNLRAQDHLQIKYHHVILKGTPNEVGQLQGEFLRQTNRPLTSFEPPEPEQFADALRRLYDEFCPGLCDEIQGLADCLEISFEKALFCATLSPLGQGCTNAVALPAIIANHHTLIARNYEMGLADTDLRLCTMQVDQRPIHLGFSDMCTGRLEGLNQHGLGVTSSIAWDSVPGDWQEANGLHYALAVRLALEQCRNIHEAVELWLRLPIGSNAILLAADRSGSAACVEIAGRKRFVKRIDSKTDEQFLVAANHYNLVDFSAYPRRTASEHSLRRTKLLTAWLEESRGQITVNGIKAFLDREWATGISSYSPELRAGTLWSMVMDITTGEVEIRFGPPPHNAWRPFTLDGSISVREYMAEFPCQ